MKEILKKYKNQWILISITLIVFLLTTRLTYVFGSNTDWINQHTIIPEYFRQTFYQTGKLLPNLALNYGGGQNIFNFSYYGLLSPLILPSYLLPFLSMTSYMTIVNVLVVIASSLLFYTFLKRHNFNDSIALTTSILLTLAAPLIFHMHRHIMFVNYMPFLIMSFLGVDNFIEKRKKNLLIISVFLMIMTSYYYSVGGIIVTGIYFIYAHLAYHKVFSLKTFSKDLLKFIALLFVAILMSAILLLPTMYTLLIGRGESESHYSLLSLLTPYLKVHKIFCGTYAIGLSTIGFVALIYLFYTKKRHNIVAGILTSIVLFIPLFRYLLNGGLYLREKCFIPFIPLIGYFIAIFLKDLYNSKINIKTFSLYTIILCIPTFIAKPSFCYLTIIALIILMFLYEKKKKPIIINVFLILVSFATCIVENLNEDMVSIKQYQNIFNEETSTTIKKILTKDNSFYRTNNLDHPTTTMNKIYDSKYLTTNFYSSTYNKDYLEFVRNEFKNSVLDYNYFLFSANKNLLFNSFMGVKYLYTSTNPGLGYTKIDDSLYQNDLAFPIIYGTNKTTSINNYKKYAYPYNLELFLHSTIVEDNELEADINSQIKEVTLDYELIENDGVKIEKEKDGYTLKVDDSGHLVMKLNTPLNNSLLFIDLYGLKENTCAIDNIEMNINGVKNILTCKTWIYKNKNNTFHFLINEKSIDTLDITLKKGTYSITDIKTYMLDYATLLNSKKDKIEMNIEKVSNDKITGNITQPNDGYLVTSIPYDAGFKIYIDNVEVKTEKVNTAFLGAKLKAGYHRITITYQSPWLKGGKILSIIGFTIYIIIITQEQLHKKTLAKKKKEDYGNNKKSL